MGIGIPESEVEELLLKAARTVPNFQQITTTFLNAKVCLFHWAIRWHRIYAIDGFYFLY